MNMLCIGLMGPSCLSDIRESISDLAELHRLCPESEASLVDGFVYLHEALTGMLEAHTTDG